MCHPPQRHADGQPFQLSSGCPVWVDSSHAFADTFTRVRAPQPHGIVPAASGEGIADRAERDTVDQAVADGERWALRLIRDPIPQEHLEGNAAGESLAVMAERDAGDRAVTAEGGKGAMCGRIPQPHRAVLASAGQGVVAAERHAVDTPMMSAEGLADRLP